MSTHTHTHEKRVQLFLSSFITTIGGGVIKKLCQAVEQIIEDNTSSMCLFVYMYVGM